MAKPGEGARVKRAVMGGTFDRLHCGHAALLATAFAHAEEVGIGITTDQFLTKKGGKAKKGKTRPFDEREKALRAFLDQRFPGRLWYLIPLTDRWGAALEPSTQALVVSDETLPVGELANRLRRRSKAKPLTLIVCHAVLAEDLLRVSSSRIRQGKIDGDGRRLAPLRVGLGSENEVKRAGVEAAFHGLFPRTPLEVESVRPGPPNPQPWGLTEGFAGAQRRAALARGTDRDYGVGVEATAFRPDPKGPVYDVHCVAVDGADGSQLKALSAGYPLPDAVVARLTGRKTLEAAMAELGGPARVGHSTGGLLSYLTANELSREGFITAAVQSAFVPRLARRAERLPASEVLRTTTVRRT